MTKLHDLDLDDLDSALRVDVLQYALFRVLWRPYMVTQFSKSVFDSLNIRSAKAILKEHAPWESFIAAVKEGSHAQTFMGAFGTVLLN